MSNTSRLPSGRSLVPFGTIPDGQQLMATVLVCKKPDGNYSISYQLVDGERFDEDDPVHCMVSFIAQNAQQIAATAAQYRDKARAAGQRAEQRLILVGA
jgi:hypothetical protein